MIYALISTLTFINTIYFQKSPNSPIGLKPTIIPYQDNRKLFGVPGVEVNVTTDPLGNYVYDNKGLDSYLLVQFDVFNRKSGKIVDFAHAGVTALNFGDVSPLVFKYTNYQADPPAPWPAFSESPFNPKQAKILLLQFVKYPLLYWSPAGTNRYLFYSSGVNM